MYFKSFHRILAKYSKKIYNRIVKQKEKNKRAKDERIKVKKVNRGNNRGCGIVACDTSIYNGFSININTSKK